MFINKNMSPRIELSVLNGDMPSNAWFYSIIGASTGVDSTKFSECAASGSSCASVGCCDGQGAVARFAYPSWPKLSNLSSAQLASNKPKTQTRNCYLYKTTHTKEQQRKNNTNNIMLWEKRTTNIGKPTLLKKRNFWKKETYWKRKFWKTPLLYKTIYIKETTTEITSCCKRNQ